MAQSSTQCIGRDVPQETSAVAYVAPDHGAEVTDLGTMGTRPGAIDPLVRKRPSKATPRVCIYATGPWGSWLSRDRSPTGDAGWVVTPSLMPQKAGDRVKTDRRDAVPRARLARSGELTPVDVPQGQTKPGATAAGLVKRPSASSKTPSVVSTRAGSDTIAATGAGPSGTQPIAGGSRQGSARHRPHHSSLKHRSVPSPHTPHASRIWNQHATITSTRGACTRWLRPSRRGGGAMHRGGHAGGRKWGPEPVRDLQSTDAVFGLEPCRGLLRGAAPAGCNAPSPAHPGPTSSRGRRLGLSRSRQGEPTPPTANRKTAQAHPGHRLVGPGQAMHTLPTTRGTRHTCPRGHRRQRVSWRESWGPWPRRYRSSRQTQTDHPGPHAAA